MKDQYPQPRSEGVMSIAVSLILTLVTCGLFGLYWQYKQMQTLNRWLEREEFSFVTWLLLTIITCGLFAIYYEYKMAKGINEVQYDYEFIVNDDVALLCVLLTAIGLGFVSLAIQQGEINKFYNETGDI